MQAAQSHHRSPPPSYCSGDPPEAAAAVVATVSRSSPHVPASDCHESRAPPPATSTTPLTAASPPATRTAPAAGQFPAESFQSLDNIDLAIFGSSSAVNGPAATQPSAAGAPADGGGGLVLDVSAVFTGSRPPTRLMTPRFRPRTQRHVFDPTALYSVEETSVKTWERTRAGGVFTRL